MGGVKSLLKAAEQDMAQLKKAQAESSPVISIESTSEEKKQVYASSSGGKIKVPKTGTTNQNRGGRPTNAEKGIPNRKQYTLTLKEEDYKRILSNAREEDISFAKFMEKAAFFYIENKEKMN